LEHGYFGVFLCALNNAVILRLYTYEQFFAFYEQAIALLLQFARRTRMLLNFATSFKWLEWECSSWQEFQPFYKQVQDKNKKLLEHSKG
jgi:hypothetical protein